MASSAARLLAPARRPRHGVRVRLAVTTPFDPPAPALDAARDAAARLGLPFLSRGRRSLAEVAVEAGVEALLVLGARASLFTDGRDHPPVMPGTAHRGKRPARRSAAGCAGARIPLGS